MKISKIEDFPESCVRLIGERGGIMTIFNGAAVGRL